MAKLVTCRRDFKELFDELVQRKMGINLHKFFSQCVCVTSKPVRLGKNRCVGRRGSKANQSVAAQTELPRKRFD